MKTRKEKTKINWLLRFCCFCRSPPARKGRGEEVVPDPLGFLDFLVTARDPTVPVVQKAFPVIPDCFGAMFVIFWFV
jgi:hypothetical protein